MIESDDADCGWVDTHYYSGLSEHVQEMTLSGDKSKSLRNSRAKPVKEVDNDDDDDDEEPEDMDMFIASGGLEEDDKVNLNFTLMFFFNNQKPFF